MGISRRSKASFSPSSNLEKMPMRHARNRGNAISQPGNSTEDKLEIESKMNVFKSISNRLRRMTSISLQKASVSDQNERKEIEQNEAVLFVSPDSQSRTSISMCSDFVYPKMNSTYSLSMDQLNQLQHGFAVQSDGICIKLNADQNIKKPRNRMLSQFNGGYSKICNNLGGNALMIEEDELSSSGSHESMYIHYDENETVETDDGITPYSQTPTNGSPTDFKLSVNSNEIDTLPECLEGSCPTDQILK